MEKPRYSMTKPNLNNIFLLIQPYRGKLQHKKGNYTQENTRNYASHNKHKRRESQHIIPPSATKITGIRNHLSLISLIMNGLNTTIKRHRLTN
jgi:hypothetical protein